MSPASRLGAVLMLGLAACSSRVDAPPVVTDAWIRAAPPAASMQAGYLVISNPSARPLRLLSVSSPDFERVELHRTEIRDGVARMLAENEVEVPARGSVAFAPGGRHLMLFGPIRPLAPGDTVRMTLELADSVPVDVSAVVRKGPDADNHQHHH